MEQLFDEHVFEEDAMSAVLVDQVPVPGRPQLRLVVDNGPRPQSVEQPRPAMAPIVLTARGRLVVRALLGAVAVATAVALGVLLGLALRPEPAAAAGAVTVAPGDSLWTVASQLTSPGEDARDVVERIVTLNGLTDHVVHPGQELLVPAG